MNPQALAWIEDQKSDLVAAAVQNTPSQDVSKSQLQTLLTVASDEPVEVLRSHLRYQMGRGDKAWKDWKAGQNVLDLLSNEVVERCSQAASSGSLGAIDPSAQDAIQRRVAALLIGYIIREHTYQSALAYRGRTGPTAAHNGPNRGKASHKGGHR